VGLLWQPDPALRLSGNGVVAMAWARAACMISALKALCISQCNLTEGSQSKEPSKDLMWCTVLSALSWHFYLHSSIL
jgi:hypothetical protein